MQEWTCSIKDSRVEQDFFSVAANLRIFNMPPELRILPCLGFVQNKLHSRLGIIYRPPSYVRDYRAFSEDKRRTVWSCIPATLSELLECGSSTMLSLGERFELARKLTRSLYVMHAAELVHRK